jgi:hypothetical protein
MEIDGTNKTKISNDNAQNIQIVGDWIYYENQNDNKSLYRIRIDGTMKQAM